MGAEAEEENMQTSTDGTLIEELVRAAAASPSGRAGRGVHGGNGRPLGQTLTALAKGTVLGEHANPGQATFLVLVGRVRLTAGDHVREGVPFEVLAVPDDAVYSLRALEDSVVMLSVARPANQ